MGDMYDKNTFRDTWAKPQTTTFISMLHNDSVLFCNYDDQNLFTKCLQRLQTVLSTIFRKVPQSAIQPSQVTTLLGNSISRFLLWVSCIFEISVDICTKGLVTQKLTWYGESLREPYTRSIFSTNFHSWLGVYCLKKLSVDNGVHIFP